MCRKFSSSHKAITIIGNTVSAHWLIAAGDREEKKIDVIKTDFILIKLFEFSQKILRRVCSS